MVFSYSEIVKYHIYENQQQKFPLFDKFTYLWFFVFYISLSLMECN